MYVIDRLHTLDLVGGTPEFDYDVGAHAASGAVYVARSTSGTVKLGTYQLASDGTITSAGADLVVGHGTKTRIVVFDNQRLVVLWLDKSSALRARGYYAGGALAGSPVTVESQLTDFDVVAVGVTTGVQHGGQGVDAYDNYRNFAFTTTSANGGWELWFGTVIDSAEVTTGPHTLGGSGDKVAVSCASLNEVHDHKHPRTALTLWRDAGQVRTRSWRIANAGVTSLASATETKALGVGVVHGMSMAQNDDFFATLVSPGASNATATLQLVALGASGAMNPYATAEIAESPTTFARLRASGNDAAVAYKTPEGHLAVAAWRFAAPGSGSAPRTVLASRVGTEQPTQVRIASLVPAGDDDPVPLVTLNRVAAGSLRLVSWRFHQTSVGPVGPGPVGG